MTKANLHRLLTVSGAAALAAAAACGGASSRAAGAPTPAEAKTFVDAVNTTLGGLNIAAAQAGWVAQNFITDDTEALDARATREAADATARFVKESTRFDRV